MCLYNVCNVTSVACTPKFIYMKTYCLFIFSLLLSTLCMAQKEKEDVLYLKSGSVIRGNIKEQTTEKIKVELLGGSVFVFNATEIDSIKQEDPYKVKLKRFAKDYYRRNRGYRNMTEIGFIYGPGQSGATQYYYTMSNADDFGLSINTVNGYQIWPYLYVAAGVGIDRYITYRQTFSPFYLRLASEFLKKKVTPYVYCDAGYALMWGQKSDEWTKYSGHGGLYIAAGGGVRIYTRSRASVILSAGYKRTESETSWYYVGNENYKYSNERIYQRLMVNVGVSF